MNEMYSMGLSLHSFGALSLIGIIFLNIAVLLSTKDLHKYKKTMSVFLMPLSITVVGLTIFTGVVMMAAKHIGLSIPNVMMIVIAWIVGLLEIWRAKTLTNLSLKVQDGLKNYKSFSIKILLTELLLIVAITIWMYSL